MIGAFLRPAGAIAAECTDTWTATEASWNTAADWSAGHVPTATDVACIGSGKTVTSASGGEHVAYAVQGAGSIVMAGGSLEVVGDPEGAAIQRLSLSNSTLTGPGTVEIAGSLIWKTVSHMTGAGSTGLLPGATATFESSGLLSERTFVNEGTFNFASSYLTMKEGAVFENTGIFDANSEGPGIGAEAKASAEFVNTGTVRKTMGTLTTAIKVPFVNEGDVEVQTGTLEFAGSTHGLFGDWSAAEGAWLGFRGALELFGGTIGGDVWIQNHTTSMIEGVEAVGLTIDLTGGELGASTLEVRQKELPLETFYINGSSVLTGPADVRIAKTLVWLGQAKMSGSGSTTLLPSATATVGASQISERTFINEGTFTFTNNLLTLKAGARIENVGTFIANSENLGISEDGSLSAEFLNTATGLFEKTEGTGTTRVTPAFVNEGEIRELSGHLKFEAKSTVASSTATPHHGCSGDPVDCGTGNFSATQTDLEIGGRGVGLDLSRTYSAQAAAAKEIGIFGYGWTNSFGDHLTSEGGGATELLTESSGSTVPFTYTFPTYTAPGWSRDELTGDPTAGFMLTLPNQTEEGFSGAGRLESVTDRDGNETTLTYSGSGELEKITDSGGRSITLTYNAEGLVEKATDPMGHVVKYAYESKSLKSVTLPAESAANWQFKYDASHRMTSMIDGRGGKTANEYDSSNRVISQTNPAGETTTWKYEGFHTTITNKATGAVISEWFNSNNQPYSITSGYGTASATTESFTYTAAGLLASRKDGNGHTTTYGYDGEGNRTSERDAEGDEARWTYNAAHELTSETKPDSEKTTIPLDADGNPETVSRPAPESKTQTVSYTYGPHGEVESMTNPLGATWTYGYDKYGDRTSETDPEGDERTWAYNEDSQVISTVSPRGNEAGAEPAKFTTSIERDAQGRPIKITDPLGGTAKRAYDADGNVESITDPNGHKTKFTYDADDELTKVERPNGDVEETGYDGSGQVTSQTDGNKQKTTYVRNVLEQPVEIIDPLERKTIQTFDAAGNLLTRTDPDGQTTTYGYDKANRLKEISYSGEAGQDATYGYDEDGDLTSMVDGTGESTWEYDQLGRLVHSKDGHGETVSWEWNLGNEPVGLTYPNGKAISRAYDEDGRLESITDWLGHTTSFAYNRDSDPTATTFPTGTGDTDEYAWDRADRMSAATMRKGAETLASLAYSRDPAGQLESLISKGLPGVEEESFAYDEDERLTKAGSAEFGYDPADNITKAPGTTNSFDKAGEIESATGATFTFDKEGQRTKEAPSSGPATTYKYDQAGSLTGIERSEESETPAIAESFGYDGLGLLASRTVGLSTTHFVWDPTESPELLLSDGADSYVYGPGGLPVEEISSEEVPTYLHHDQLGSTRLLTNASGEVAATFTYGPYGGLTGHTGTATTALGYAGQYTLGQSGLLSLRARYYDPATAQFLTVDPLASFTRVPYLYAGDDPANRRDRTGRAAESAEGGCPSPICFPFPTRAQAESAGAAIGGIPREIGEFGSEIGSGVSSVWNSVFGGGESSSEEAEEEGEEEVPCVDGGEKRIGDRREQELKDKAFVEGLERVERARPTNPFWPPSGSRWERFIAVLGSLLGRSH